jgi:hypothetical protein
MQSIWVGFSCIEIFGLEELSKFSGISVPVQLRLGLSIQTKKCVWSFQKLLTNLIPCFNSQANYTDRATARGRRIVVPTFVGVSRGQRGGTTHGR